MGFELITVSVGPYAAQAVAQLPRLVNEVHSDEVQRAGVVWVSGFLAVQNTSAGTRRLRWMVYVDGVPAVGVEGDEDVPAGFYRNLVVGGVVTVRPGSVIRFAVRETAGLGGFVVQPFGTRMAAVLT